MNLGAFRALTGGLADHVQIEFQSADGTNFTATEVRAVLEKTSDGKREGARVKLLVCLE